MTLNMAERRAVTKEMVKRYRKATKKQKGIILTELAAMNGWSRDHARRALRNAARPQPQPPPARARPMVYDDTVIQPLKKVWAVLNGPCGQRLAPYMGEIVEVLERCGELKLKPAVRKKLLAISSATIDRKLAAERSRLKIQGSNRHQAWQHAQAPDPHPHLRSVG